MRCPPRIEGVQIRRELHQSFVKKTQVSRFDGHSQKSQQKHGGSLRSPRAHEVPSFHLYKASSLARCRR
jgi:hypothetical protein